MGDGGPVAPVAWKQNMVWRNGVIRIEGGEEKQTEGGLQG